MIKITNFINKYKTCKTDQNIDQIYTRFDKGI